MKISLNTISWYGYSQVVDLPLEELLTKIGEQIGAVEEVEHLGPKYDGIVVVKIISCIKHPNADKLHVCKIDDGGVVKKVERDSEGHVQVVCGAPNVAEGQTVAWLPPGVTVPSTVDSDPFVLEAREIRGQVSNGMLASPKELDISDSHGGILEIKEDEVGVELMKPGTEFKKLYGLDDVIIDIENKMFTHRPDCFGMLGVAREIAGVQSQKFVSPDWYLQTLNVQKTANLPLDVRVECPELVPRFMAVTISGVKVGPSPVWLQSFLTRLGVKSINNVVDLTNYFMHLTGQPTHAYDYDKVAKLSGSNPTIVAREAKKGERATLLNDKEYEFDSPAVVIATDKSVIGLGGIMGGTETEVDNETTNLIIECANFDMYNIRRSSMKYGLFTDAVTRFTKGQSTNQNDKVLAKLVSDIIDMAGGQQASEYLDIKEISSENVSVEVSSNFINDRLGSSLSASDMQKLLENVEFEVKTEQDNMVVKAPFWRTDIEISEDVVEEVGRLYGYHNLPIQLPVRRIDPAPLNEDILLADKIRNILSSAGANEMLNYTFVHGDLLTTAEQDVALAYKLSNAISPDLHFYRLSLTPSLLEKVHPNIKSGHSEFAIFEIGKAHMIGDKGEDGLPREHRRLAFVYAVDPKIAKDKYEGAPYYQSRKYLIHLSNSLGFSPRLVPLSEFEQPSGILEQMARPYLEDRTAVIVDSSGNFMGVVGEFKPSTKRKLKLPSFVSGFEINLDAIKNISLGSSYEKLSKFPSTHQDITLSTAVDCSYRKIFDEVYSAVESHSSVHGYRYELELVNIYCPSKSIKNYTFRLKLSHDERTLVTEEVNNLLDHVASAVGNSINAKRI